MLASRIHLSAALLGLFLCSVSARAEIRVELKGEPKAISKSAPAEQAQSLLALRKCLLGRPQTSYLSLKPCIFEGTDALAIDNLEYVREYAKLNTLPLSKILLAVPEFIADPRFWRAVEHALYGGMMFHIYQAPEMSKAQVEQESTALREDYRQVVRTRFDDIVRCPQCAEIACRLLPKGEAELFKARIP